MEQNREARIDAPTQIVLVRHGECEGNREGRFRGRADFPLNEVGLAQARAAAAALKEIPLERVFTSPLLRARQTAEILAEGRDLPVEAREGFTNLALGPWEGRTKEEIRQECPVEWSLWLHHPERLRLPGAESLGDVGRRALANLDHLVRTYPGSTFAVVSHRAVLKPLLAAALGIAEPSFWRIHMETASVSLLRHTPQQGYCLVRLNDTHHLETFLSEWV